MKTLFEKFQRKQDSNDKNIDNLSFKVDKLCSKVDQLVSRIGSVLNMVDQLSTDNINLQIFVSQSLVDTYSVNNPIRIHHVSCTQELTQEPDGTTTVFPPTSLSF